MKALSGARASAWMLYLEKEGRLAKQPPKWIPTVAEKGKDVADENAEVESEP